MNRTRFLPWRDNKTGRFVKTKPPYTAPCYYCGASSELVSTWSVTKWGTAKEDKPRIWWVQCTECGARSPELDAEHAVKEWNELAEKLGAKIP